MSGSVRFVVGGACVASRALHRVQNGEHIIIRAIVVNRNEQTYDIEAYPDGADAAAAASWFAALASNSGAASI